jgi:hypothetical protein
MSHDANSDTGKNLDLILRQTAELRRLCLSLREAARCDADQALAEGFAAAMRTPSGILGLPSDVLRAGFRSLWCQGRYAKIVALAQDLPEHQREADEIVLMYTLCAARKTSSHPQTGSAD